MIQRLFFAIVLLLSTFAATAQPKPVKWTFDSRSVGGDEYELIFTAKIDEGWTVYSQFLTSDDGPVRTSFSFKEDKKNPHFQLVGKAEESGGRKEIDDKVFGMKLIKFYHDGIFTQKIKASDPSKPIEGYLTFMTCNDKMCLPPEDVDFSFRLPAAKTAAEPPTSPVSDGKNPAPAADAAMQGTFDSKRAIDANKFVRDCGAAVGGSSSDSLFWVFILGFLGGLLALLTPCVFPMIPLTVSYFTKSSTDKATGIRNAVIYGLSIIFIYVTIGIVLTSMFGPTILNEMSTDMYFNIAFFVIFVIFAFSFFGYYEITLPSSWTTKTDQASNQGGLIGIFFMAFTLSLVSFSCTGPIIGTLLVQTVQNVDGLLFNLIPTKPLAGMFGFSLALALPFGLFAAFPGWLSSLPKSGSWLTNVKVTLGFLELALALKFFSTADMVRHWGLMKYEVFIGLWILIFLLLAAYHFGLIRFPHDNPNQKVGNGRKIIGTLSVLFVIYLASGFTYKPLTLLSGLAPPVHYSIYGPKGCPHGLDCYHDFDEGLARAKALNKPLFVDFTGYGCVNCRKMEENVWVKPEILKYLKDDYVVVSLYVDDRERLFPDDKQKYLLDKNNNERIRDKGRKWASFQINNFGTSSQPYYILMHNDGTTLLTRPTAYTPDVTTYRDFLDCGLKAFKTLK